MYKYFLFFIFYFLLKITLFSICIAQELRNPNIIIIYADDVGYGDISAYGSQLIQTPHIDQLAKEGIRFTNAYATSSMCTPSRYSLLTGKYAFRHESAGILSAEDPLIIEPGSTTLPGVLREAGYITSIVGKWHLGLGSESKPINWNGDIKPGPLEVGFNQSFILPVTNDRVPTVYVKGHRVHQLSENDEPLRVKYPEEGHHEYQEEQFGENAESSAKAPQPLVGNLPSGHTHLQKLRYSADAQHSGTIVNGVSRIGYMAGGGSAWWDDEQMAAEFVNHSRSFIENNLDNPFFLYLSMHENHVPRIPNSKFVDSSGTGLRGDVVVELDWAVGEILNILEKNDIRNNTLIIFTSDNGPVFFDGYEDGSLEDHNGHDPRGIYGGGKYTAYEGGTRMPTIISWPGEIEGAKVSDALISQVDFLQSLAALVGAEVPGKDLDSKNVLEAMLGRSSSGREYLVQQSSDGLALRKGPWKYIEPGERSSWAYNRHNRGDTPLNTPPLGSEEYLFNLAQDPEELVNVAKKNPKKLKEMRNLLNNIKKSQNE